MATGTATIDFGSGKGTEFTTVTVAGQTGITTASYVEAFMMADVTTDHTADEHSIAPIKLTCGDIVDNTSFVIKAVCEWPDMTGQFTVHWVWV